MKMNIKAFGLAVGGLWAACVLLLGLAHLVWSGYGVAFLDLVASLYPGYHPANGLGAVFVSTLYALVDGTVGGAVLAWLYNIMGGTARTA
jgi:hypothetical protein